MNNDAINKAKEILELQADRTSLKTMADYVKEYLIAYCEEDPGLVERVDDPEKSFMDCIGYIKKKALDWLKEQQNLELSGYVQGIGGDVPPDICYQWAVEYYYSKPEPKPEPKMIESTGSKSKSKACKKGAAAKEAPKDEPKNLQMSLLENMGKQANKAEPISLFGSMGNEELSGETDNDEPDCVFGGVNDNEFLAEEDEGEPDSVWGCVEILTEEDISDLPFGKEVA